MWVLVQIKDWFKHWAIALLFLLIVVLVWSLVFTAMSPFLIPVFIKSKYKDEGMIFGKKAMYKAWAKNMFIVQDQAANTVLGGSMKKHVSGRVGYLAIAENPIAMKMAVVIDAYFRVFHGQKNHSRVSVEAGYPYNENWGG